MTRTALAALVTALVCAPAAAQNYQLINQYDQKVRAGQSTRVYTWFNCRNPEAIGGEIGKAQHGTITVRRATQARCGYQNYPASELHYTPQPGFRGRDDIVIFSQFGDRVLKALLVE